MNIGIMRNYKKPSYLSELIAIYSKAYDINVLYMRPNDVNIKTGKVRALTLIKGKWIKINTDIPKFIDISPFCFKEENNEIMEYLRENTSLSDNGLRRTSKITFINRLKKDTDFNYLIIPTNKVNAINDVKEFIDRYKKIILKPSSGQFGANIFFLKYSDGKYVLLYGSEKQELNDDELLDFYRNNIEGKDYIIQKFINSKTKQGYPFDCRINMEKNNLGEWTVARKFIRIGIGQKVVSNISQGGAVSGLKSFLNANFQNDKAKEIERKLNVIAKTLPQKVEEMRRQELMIMGIDVGIDKDGSVYLFEVNSAPGTTQLRAQAAELRAQYYSYIRDRIQSERKEVN